jgi:acyl dehydratase
LEILGLYFEDFPVGKAGGSVPRTITPTDLELFEEMSVWPKYSAPGGQLVPEMLVTMISAGLMTRQGVYEGTLLGIIGNYWKFKAPVVVGDTLKMKYVVAEASLSRNGEKGIIVFKITTTNQRGEIVAVGEMKTMMLARASLNSDREGATQ